MPPLIQQAQEQPPPCPGTIETPPGMPDIVGQGRQAYGDIRDTFTGFAEDVKELGTFVVDRLSWAWGLDDEPDLGAQLRQRWQENKARFDENMSAVKERDRERAAAVAPAAPEDTGEIGRIEAEMTERMKRLSVETLSNLEESTMELADTPWRQTVLDMIAAERQTRAR